MNISCIIPAYNEEKRIGKVLSVISNHPLISQTIVVNDGSKDRTLNEIKKFKGVKIISYEKNIGKTKAVLKGILSAKNKMIMLIDSDLQGLTKEDITNLIKPVVEKKADLTISLRKNSLGLYKMIGLDFVSGERVFNKSLLGNLKNLKKLAGFGLESYMNKKAIEKKMRIKVVPWKNVSHARKSEKIGFWKGTFAEILMLKHIIKTIGLSGVLYQNFKLLSMRV